jgi:hypothetical protein
MVAKNIGVLKIDVAIYNELNYSLFKELLGKIEKNLRLMDIEDLNFDNATGQTKLTINTYYIKQ